MLNAQCRTAMTVVYLDCKSIMFPSMIDQDPHCLISLIDEWCAAGMCRSPAV